MSAVFLLGAGLLAAVADPANAAPDRDSDNRMEWWREARFGMFVHYGLYSGLGGYWKGEKVSKKGTEWIQKLADLETGEYEEEAVRHFKPDKGFARQWATLAANAGCRYVVFTTKHHDGFCLHDSSVTRFDARDVTGRDLCREIVDALRAEGLGVGFYHSLIDWHHPHYMPARKLPYPDKARKNLSSRDHGIYLEYLHHQAEELMSNYGKIDILWWDFSKPGAEGERWKANDLMAMVRRHQPEIVFNNRLYDKHAFTDPELAKGRERTRGDFMTPEGHVPATGLPGIDWESCMTMNTSWGYYGGDDSKWKTEADVIRTLVEIVSKGGNYLLNLGPRADGSVPAKAARLMAGVGRWMKINGESIYGTQASPVNAPAWGRYTRKPGKLYAHVLRRPKNGRITISFAAAKEGKAYLLADEQRGELAVERSDDGLVVTLPEEMPDPIVSVVVIDFSNGEPAGNGGR